MSSDTKYSRERLESLAKAFTALREETGDLAVDAKQSARSDMFLLACKAHVAVEQAWRAVAEAYAAMGIRPV